MDGAGLGVMFPMWGIPTLRGRGGIQIKIQKPRAGETLSMEEDKDRVKMQMALMFSPSTLFPKGSFPSLNSLSLLVPHN